MSLSIGIIGLPNVGKSTLFNALTQAGAEASNYPFCTTDQNVGMAEVPDERLEELNRILEPTECIPATIQFVDIAGLVRGASMGEGLGNKFLGHIRSCDAIIHIVRCFEDRNVVHVEGSIDPVRDMEVVDTELAMADLETIERQVVKQEKLLRTNPRMGRERLEVLLKIRDFLEKGIPARMIGLSEDEVERIKEYNLLTLKPVIYVANIAEEDIKVENEGMVRIRNRVGGENLIPISAKIEEEISELPVDERKTFLVELELERSGLDQIVLAGYRLLNLITFYTTANEKLRAWPVVRGTKAPQAAGKIHSDMERGFIRAEVVAYSDLARHKTLAAVHQKGLVRAEGKGYEVQDGDVIHFLFRV
ncbi:MAG TPA: redox-regulated ATPase YchF [Candidatus Latescibacteria bacterium]|nr:redox-regulated ATPase YchF [Candidatus Latescibacterota bacterium]